MNALFITDEAVILKVLFHFVGHQQSCGTGPNMNDAKVALLRMPLLLDLVTGVTAARCFMVWMDFDVRDLNTIQMFRAWEGLRDRGREFGCRGHPGGICFYTIAETIEDSCFLRC